MTTMQFLVGVWSTVVLVLAYWSSMIKDFDRSFKLSALTLFLTVCLLCLLVFDIAVRFQNAL